MKIVFMGTPDFAVVALKKLVNENHEILAVFTQPDKPFGRKHILKAPPVKMEAEKLGLTVRQPCKLKSEEEIEFLKTVRPDVIIVVAYGKILPKEILNIPKYGCINVHGSLLPKYRGASPIQTSILNGDDVTGVTVMYMSEGLDSGDIIDMAKTHIGQNETATQLFNRLAPMGANLLCDVLNKIERGIVNRTPQNEEDVSYAPILTKEMARINFNKPAVVVHKLICGLSEWPCAYCYFRGKKLKIYRSVLANEYFGNAAEVLDNKRFIVGCGEGAVEFLDVQLEGKKRMLAKDFINGVKLNAGEMLE